MDNIIPLVDILSEQLGERVVMIGTAYVLMRDNSLVSQSNINKATVEQTRLSKIAKEEADYQEWKALEADKASRAKYKESV